MRNSRVLAAASCMLLAAQAVGSITALASQNTYSVDMTDYNDTAWAYVAMANDDTVVSGINIRETPSASGKVVGYLYRGGAVTVLDKGDTWTQIQSGEVTGYILNRYLVYGTQAKGLAEYYGTYGVKASWDDVKVFADDNAAAKIVSVADDGDTFAMVSQDNGWIEVKTADNETVYVSSEDVTPVILMYSAVAVGDTQSNAASQVYQAVNTDADGQTESIAEATADTVEQSEDESADSQLAEDSSTVTAEEETAAASYEENYDDGTSEESITAYDTSDQEASYFDETYQETSSYEDSSYTEETYQDESNIDASYPDTSYEDSVSGSEVNTVSSNTYTYTAPSTEGMDLATKAATLYQAYVEAQTAADNAVTNYTDEQTVYDTAAAAQQAYAAYVEAQNAADAASWGSTDTAAQSTAASQTYTETEAVWSETDGSQATDGTNTSSGDTYEDTSSGDTSYEEAAQSDTTDSYSSSDLELLAALIYCEAGNQPYEGQVAVGAVVMNRVASSSFANTVSGVIYESGQFTPAYSGALASALANGSGSGYIAAASAAMAGEDPTGGCLYFNTSHGSGVKIGDHWFY